MVEHPVAFHRVAHSAGDNDAVAHRQDGDIDSGSVGLIVGVHEVPDDGGVALGVAQLIAAAVGDHPGAIEAEHRVDDVEVATRIRSRVAEAVVLADDIGDHRVAGVAVADVDAGVGAAGGIDVVDLPVHRIERVDAIVTGAVGRKVRAPVPVGSGPKEAVGGEVHRRHVLHGDAFGAQNPHPVVESELSVEDDLIAVEPANGELVGGDVHRLVVGAWADENEIAWLRCVDGGLDGVEVGGHLQHSVFGPSGGNGGHSFRARGTICARDGGPHSRRRRGVGLFAVATRGQQRCRHQGGDELAMHPYLPPEGHGAVTMMVPNIPAVEVPWMLQ